MHVVANPSSYLIQTISDGMTPIVIYVARQPNINHVFIELKTSMHTLQQADPYFGPNKYIVLCYPVYRKSGPRFD